MKKLFNKIKISNWPLVFLLLVLSIVFFLFLVTEKYLITIIIFTLILFLSFKVKIPKFPLILFFLSLLTKILVILIINPQVESDFLTMYNASKLLRVGDLSYTKLDYFIKWGYQVGHVFYQAMLLKIFNSIFFLKLVNCLALSGTTVLIYLIVKELLNDTSAKFASLSYMFYLQPVLLTTVLTNQHVPTFLFFTAFYIIIKKDCLATKPIIKYLISGLLIGLGNIMRPEGIIFILTIIIYLICICYKTENIKSLLLKIMVLVISYTLITKGCSLIFQATGISKNGLANKDPLWKFVLGTNYESQGRYSDNDVIYLSDSKKELEIIKQRTINNLPQFSKLLAIKAKVFWTGNDLYWSNDYLEKEDITILSHNISGKKVNEYCNFINEQVYIITFMLSLVGLYSLIKTKYDKRVNLFIILLSIYFTVYLFIEIMNRYTYTPRVAIFILASFGIDFLTKNSTIKKLKTKKIKSN